MTKRATTSKNQAERWFRNHAENFLRRIGVRECRQIVDIGCHKGRFTIAAARIVGLCGAVYAIDKDKKVLASMKTNIKKAKQQNITVIKADLAKNTFTAIKQESIDLALLYDMLHRGYLPERRERRNMLRHVFRIVKPGGILSCFPTHLKKYGFTFKKLLAEITEAGITLQEEVYPRLVHDEKLVRGRVFRFSKPLAR